MSPKGRGSGTAMPSRSRAPRGQGEQLHDEILDAAEQLLLERGSMDAVSIRAVATSVGVTAPSIYLHFADKDELFFEVCERRFEAFDGVLAAATEGLDDPVERLRAMGRAYVFYGVEHAEFYQLLFGPKSSQLVGDRDLGDSAGMRAFGRLVGAIQEAIDSGQLGVSEAWLAAFTVWSAVHGTVMIVLAKDGLAGSGFALPDLETLADACCHTVLRGLAAD